MSLYQSDYVCVVFCCGYFCRCFPSSWDGGEGGPLLVIPYTRNTDLIFPMLTCSVLVNTSNDINQQLMSLYLCLTMCLDA